MILYSEFAYRFQFSEEKKNVLELVFFVTEIFNKYRKKLGLSWAKLSSNWDRLRLDLSPPR